MTEPRRRWILATLCVPFVALAAAKLVAPDAALPLIWASSGAVWAFLPAWLLLLVALARRDRLAAALSGAVVLCHVAWVAPTFVPEARADVAGPRVRVVAANVLYVNRTPDALLDELLATEADILVLEEVSPMWLARLESDRVRAAYPHRDLLARDDAFGIAVLARPPIDRSDLVDLGGVPMIDATVRVGGRPLRVFGVHTLPPYDAEYARVWRAQLAQLRARVAAVDEPLVVAGDFNGTLHNPGVAGLRDAGVRDVHDALGAGVVSTWPNGIFPAPPLALDHVFVSDHLTPLAVREGAGAGSDHRPLIVDLRVDGA